MTHKTVQQEIKEIVNVITQMQEKVAAQAAVIEKLTKRLASTNISMEVVCAIHPDSACAKYELAENMNALAISTNSTQILDEVRKYEELLYAVQRKFPDETRHQTALRYIKTAESPSYTNAAMKEIQN